MASPIVTEVENGALLALGSYPKLVDCFNLNVDFNLIENHKWDYIEPICKFNKILVIIYNKLRNSSIDVFVCEIISESPYFSVVSCHSPNLERFNLVRMGAIMAPGPRALRALIG